MRIEAVAARIDGGRLDRVAHSSSLSERRIHRRPPRVRYPSASCHMALSTKHM
jgi:hypothetical protein